MKTQDIYNKIMINVSNSISDVLNENTAANKQNMIICPKEFKNVKNSWKVFLAGPIQGAEKWQFEMPYINNVIWLSPRRLNNDKTLFNSSVFLFFIVLNVI